MKHFKRHLAFGLAALAVSCAKPNESPSGSKSKKAVQSEPQNDLVSLVAEYNTRATLAITYMDGFTDAKANKLDEICQKKEENTDLNSRNLHLSNKIREHFESNSSGELLKKCVTGEEVSNKCNEVLKSSAGQQLLEQRKISAEYHEKLAKCYKDHEAQISDQPITDY
ncbi:hypothetical protein GF340_05140 [Candidatus Peregrinibacteria bacterium]|nr:hypothetical protein [Candidatus Peregrinibacteria bacterium]